MLLGALPGSQAQAKAGGRSDQVCFDQALACLRQAPDDRLLRRCVIELSKTSVHLPVASPAQDDLDAQARLLAKNVRPKDQAGLLAAIAATSKASLRSPWRPGFYYRQAALEIQAGLDQDAIRDFGWYLMARPKAGNRARVLARMAILQASLDQQAAEAPEVSAQTTAAALAPLSSSRRQARETGGKAALVLGVGSLAVGAWELIVGYGNLDGTEANARNTATPSVGGGADYNIAYQGRYWSSASYKQAIAGQRELTAGWLCLGLGAAVTAAGALLLPGPGPDPQALLHLQDGRLAWGLPPVESAAQAWGLRTTLFEARF